jgi:hypothetical protein
MWVHTQASCASDSQASCASIVCFDSQASCSDEMRRPNNSCPNTIGFEWRRDLQGRRFSTLHHTAPIFKCMCERMCIRYISRLCVQYSSTRSRWCCGEHRSLISSVPKRMCFLWRRELIKRRRSPQHACMSLVENRSVCCWKLTMIWRVPMAMQFLPKYYVISMKERIARSSALSTTLSIHSFIQHHTSCMWVLMWLDYQWFDDSCDSILSDIQYRFP